MFAVLNQSGVLAVKFIGLLVLVSLILQPVQVAAQTNETDRTVLLQKIELLTQLIALLQAQLARTNQPTYQLYPSQNKVIEAGEQATIARLRVVPRSIDTYLNKAELEVTNISGTNMPWDTFESVKVYYKGVLLHEQQLDDETLWSWRLPGGTTRAWYGLNVFTGNVKIPTTAGSEVTFVYKVRDDAESSVWDTRIPQGGITVWDSVNKHRYLGGPRELIRFSVSGDDELSDDTSSRTNDSVDGDEVDLSFVRTPAQVMIAGAYEGGYPDGVRHGYNYHPEGEITVDVSSTMEDTLLVLSAYEPVHWQIEGVNKQYVEAVLVTGYHEQRVSGLAEDVPIIYKVYEDGDTEFFIVYNTTQSSSNQHDFDNLADYIEDLTGVRPYLFFGEYDTDQITVSIKG